MHVTFKVPSGTDKILLRQKPRCLKKSCIIDTCCFLNVYFMKLFTKSPVGFLFPHQKQRQKSAPAWLACYTLSSNHQVACKIVCKIGIYRCREFRELATFPPIFNFIIYLLTKFSELQCNSKIGTDLYAQSVLINKTIGTSKFIKGALLVGRPTVEKFQVLVKCTTKNRNAVRTCVQ